MDGGQQLGSFRPIFGLLVWAAVMGLVIKGVRIPVPSLISKPLLGLLVILRLLDRDSPKSPPALRRVESARDEFSHPGTPDSSATPTSEKRLTAVLDLRTAPVLGVILLLATTVIDRSVLKLGLKGSGEARPYDVLVLFISLAYISTALDSTGALRSLAFYISQKAARRPKYSPESADKLASGRRLFSILYAFWFIFGVLVGNDPIVLSGTAFLGYFTRVTGIVDPTAWTFSQFIAANVASAVLVTSNPTNVLISGAFDLNFLTGFTAYTILPALVTAIAAFPLLYAAFTFFKPRSPADHKTTYIPAQLLPPDIAPRSALLDPAGAAFHSILMAITLTLLVGTSFVPGGKVQVWMVTAAAGIIALSRDLGTELVVGPPPKREDPIEMGEHKESTTALSRRPNDRLTLPSLVRRFSARFPTTSSTISRLPLNLLPFAGGIFILSRALTHLGWTSVFATALARISTSPASTIFFLGYFIAFVMCPLCGTNIGATILMVEILTDDNFAKAAHVVRDPRILKGAVFSTALASNLGAFSWTFSSSLAGLLWVSILRQKGIAVKVTEFAKWNLLFLPLLSTIASAIVLLEVYYFKI